MCSNDWIVYFKDDTMLISLGIKIPKAFIYTYRLLKNKLVKGVN